MRHAVINRDIMTEIKQVDVFLTPSYARFIYIAEAAVQMW